MKKFDKVLTVIALVLAVMAIILTALMIVDMTAFKGRGLFDLWDYMYEIDDCWGVTTMSFYAISAMLSTIVVLRKIDEK